MKGDDRLISPDFVERLRGMGASSDLIEFTERHVARYSQADLDRAFQQGFVAALALAVALAIVVVAFGGHP